MADIVSLADHRPDPHLSGDAVCLACRHEWAAVAPAGVTDLECPKCSAMRGLFRHPIEPESGDAWWTCNSCNAHAFSIVLRASGPHKLCLGCGLQSDLIQVYGK